MLKQNVLRLRDKFPLSFKNKTWDLMNPKICSSNISDEYWIYLWVLAEYRCVRETYWVQYLHSPPPRTIECSMQACNVLQQRPSSILTQPPRFIRRFIRCQMMRNLVLTVDEDSGVVWGRGAGESAGEVITGVKQCAALCCCLSHVSCT